MSSTGSPSSTSSVDSSASNQATRGEGRIDLSERLEDASHKDNMSESASCSTSPILKPKVASSRDMTTEAKAASNNNATKVVSQNDNASKANADSTLSKETSVSTEVIAPSVPVNEANSSLTNKAPESSQVIASTEPVNVDEAIKVSLPV